MKSYSNNLSNQGFTLIELMITVAIVGILASVAIPSYKEYLTRARVTEMINVSAPARLAVAEALMFGDTITDGTNYGISSEFVTSVIYTGGALVVTGTAALGHTVYDPGTGPVAFTLSYTAADSNGVISWTCAVSDSNYNKYVPRNCQI